MEGIPEYDEQWASNIEKYSQLQRNQAANSPRQFPGGGSAAG
jgi:hypothetical protein